jgi:hypothetical protein
MEIAMLLCVKEDHEVSMWEPFLWLWVDGAEDIRRKLLTLNIWVRVRW